MNEPQDFSDQPRQPQPYAGERASEQTGPAYSGPTTPPFGPYQSAGQNPTTGQNPVTGQPVTPSGYLGPRYGSYTAADFPAPAGVTTLPAPAPAKSAPRGRLATAVVAALVAAVVGAGTGIGTYAATSQATQTAGSSISVTGTPAANTPALDGTITAAAAKIEKSVVTITVQAGQGGDIGTGVVLDDQGHILTNNHVISAAQRSGSITVSFHDGTTAKATVVGTSASNDLAVIKVAPSQSLVPATFAKSTDLQVGQSVVAVGAPLGLSESVTSGIVSNAARPVRSGDDNDAVYLAVQTDAAINPGNSGGPLVDLNGSVIGINSSIASTGSDSGDGSSQSGNIGIGFAIPSDVATRVAQDLISSGTSTNAAMGVTVGGSDSPLATGDGVSLQSVTSDGAAAAAGLQAGDVVTKVNDFATTTADGLIAATRFYAPGTKVTVSYTHDGQAETAEVTLGTA